MSMLSLDLNLLVALHALLEERHVTKAGQRVGLSQPAMSDALRRLRRYFDDELLVRVGNRYELTPLALILRERAAEAVEKVERTFASRSSFDTSVLNRTFSIYTSGNGLVNVVRPFLDDIRAAGIALRLRVLDIGSIVDATNALRDSDGVVAPRDFGENDPSVDLYADRWAIVTAHGRDSSATLAELAIRPWVVVWDSREPYSPALKRLHALGVAPEADVVVEDLLSVPYMIAGSDRVAILPRRLAVRFPSLIDVHDGLFDEPEIIEAFWWHSAHTADPGHVWFRRLLEESAKRMADSDELTRLECPV